jgi:hypothetical protein
MQPAAGKGALPAVALQLAGVLDGVDSGEILDDRAHGNS